MRRQKTLTVVIDALLIAGITANAFTGGWRVLLLVVVPWLLWDLVRTLRPARPRVRAEFAEPGEYRVILQVPGPSPITVIREVRRTTGQDLIAAKKIVDGWPAIVVEGLSEQSAELVADRLRQVGAKAMATPIEENL
jgi:hypothetical protein